MRLHISSAMLGFVLLACGLAACTQQRIRKAGSAIVPLCADDVATIPALNLDNARFWRDRKKSFSIRAMNAASPWMTTCPVTLRVLQAGDDDCKDSKKLFDASTKVQFLLYGADRTIRFSTNAITGNPFEIKGVDLDSGIVFGQTRAYIRFHTPPEIPSPHTLFLYFLNAKKDGSVPKYYLLEDFDDNAEACKKHMPDSGDIDHKLVQCDTTSCPSLEVNELNSLFLGRGNVHILQTDTGVGTEHKP